MCSPPSYRVFRRPRYRVAYKMVTEMEWKCCHGYTGDDCCDATRVVTDTEVIAVRPPVAPTGPRGGCEPGGGGGGDGTKALPPVSGRCDGGFRGSTPS